MRKLLRKFIFIFSLAPKVLSQAICDKLFNEISLCSQKVTQYFKACHIKICLTFDYSAIFSCKLTMGLMSVPFVQNLTTCLPLKY